MGLAVFQLGIEEEFPAEELGCRSVLVFGGVAEDGCSGDDDFSVFDAGGAGNGDATVDGLVMGAGVDSPKFFDDFEEALFAGFDG